MTQIRIDTEHTREVARRLIAESDRLSEIARELQHATGGLDTWAWDGRSRSRAEPLLSRVRPESARAADSLDELGRKLRRVADTFEQKDNSAAGKLAAMPWVDFETGGKEAVAIGAVAAGFTSVGSKGIFAGTSTSYDIRDKKWQTKKEVGAKVKIVDGALYDAEDATGDVKVGGVDVGDYKADAKAGTYEAGAKVEFGEDGLTAGAYGEVGAGEATAEGVIGGSALGVAGAVAAAGPKAEGFIGIKDNTLGASIGGSLVSAEAEAGLNIAGANVGVKGGVSLGLEFGFKIGQETEVKFGPFKVGLSFGKAKGK